MGGCFLFFQKYRISKFIPESSSRGKFERRSISELLPNFSTTSGAQLKEALQTQIDAQRRMSDQLEVQKSLKLKIEAQGRYLERIAEEYKNRSKVAKPSKPFSPTSLPSLCDESESIMKEFESDSEFDRAEIRMDEEFRAQKRLRVVEDDVWQPRYKFPSPRSSESYTTNQNMILDRGGKISYPSHEMSFPWSVTACQSPLIPALYDSYN
ncbi:myb family transcription factor PHL5-like [Cornus florida]|uniref:myb family transcription factor PHL5-like n=1 Tax=Cornus florida TaxID=4283 RepID=UPI0028A0F3FF|nr:myb family transcription factor PHL5-like [Cornus florida]